MIVRAKTLEDNAQKRLGTAAFMNRTGRLQAAAAATAKTQAHSSGKSAKAMLKSSNGIAMVESMAKQQIVAADASAAQAQKQEVDAKKMIVQAGALKKKAESD